MSNGHPQVFLNCCPVQLLSYVWACSLPPTHLAEFHCPDSNLASPIRLGLPSN